MAAGDSIVSICNSALVALGEATITSLSDANKRAILCNQRYDPVRRRVLRAFPFNCAKQSAQLAAATTAPAVTYTLAYPLPADCLRVLNVPDIEFADWEIWGTQIVTDGGSGALNVVYIRDLQDPTLMDPLLVDVIAYSLAVDIAEPLTQSGDKMQRAQARLDMLLRDARLISSQEASAKPFDDDVWLRSRR